MVDTEGFPENFYLGEVPVELVNKKTKELEKRRHLVFATGEQLSFLNNAYRWYMDGTFKIIDKSFTQLYSIHAFLKGVKKFYPSLNILIFEKIFN